MRRGGRKRHAETTANNAIENHDTVSQMSDVPTVDEKIESRDPNEELENQANLISTSRLDILANAAVQYGFMFEPASDSVSPTSTSHDQHIVQVPIFEGKVSGQSTGSDWETSSDTSDIDSGEKVPDLTPAQSHPIDSNTSSASSFSKEFHSSDLPPFNNPDGPDINACLEGRKSKVSYSEIEIGKGDEKVEMPKRRLMALNERLEDDLEEEDVRKKLARKIKRDEELIEEERRKIVKLEEWTRWIGTMPKLDNESDNENHAVSKSESLHLEEDYETHMAKEKEKFKVFRREMRKFEQGLKYEAESAVMERERFEGEKRELETAINEQKELMVRISGEWAIKKCQLEKDLSDIQS
ncbi:hypothetical protein BELL_1228g00010 [Botrytis elliptica]|uniref:Uncharacterized protein n=1 Tax=Botrytis elliptica TaxID=278938 RepID=A0A4Z1IH23_9HELO|nr:hypothetical protein BELL_1228g00010 [Botrytis elliptica]